MNDHHLTIMSDLGDDVDLLLNSDAYLESKRRELQQHLSLLADELDGIIKAQVLKTQLQQKNLVPVRCVEFDDHGNPDVVIRICTLPDAIATLEDQRRNVRIPADVADDSNRQQLQIWENDGYDVGSARQLRRHPA